MSKIICIFAIKKKRFMSNNGQSAALSLNESQKQVIISGI